MIVFAAHVPHTPLMLSTIGKENQKRMKDTLEAMQRLAEEMYASRPDTVVVISSHAVIHDQAFAANLHDEYEADFSAFGDLATQREFQPDVALIDTMQRSLRRGQTPFTLDSDAMLDYGTAVPLIMLTARLERVRIVPVSHSGLDAKAHFKFGQSLKDIFAASNRRIAVISSGDLSHCLSSSGPGGYRKEGEAFDEATVRAVEAFSSSQLLNIEPEIVTAATECGYRPLMTLFGALDGMRATAEILSYESPFGVGYLAAQFHLV